ncbi:MAG: hypothetical protein QOD65_2810 [Gaiellales bacterium]|jgi:uncharacterized membrane protein|nr:hypothetical protein [Gaiellales bacterium]MDX6596374.1 hypothetical protein [Gaiellales bacterium]
MESAQLAEVPAVGKPAVTTQLAFLVLLAGSVLFLWSAPGSYQVYKALHVLAVVVWVGGDVTLTTLGIVFERKGDGPTLAALGRMGTWVGTRVYTPALFAVLIFGIALMEKGNFDWWGVFWIDFALAGWLVAACVGVGFVGPELGRIDKAAQEFGPTSAEVGRRVKRLFMIFRFDTALLVLILIDMVAKPSF